MTATTDHLKLIGAWFRRWLKNDTTALPEDDPEVALWVYGADKWRSEKTWPVLDRARVRSLYLSAGRRLVEAESDASGAEIAYDADPTVGAHSVLFDGGGGLGEALEQGPDDVKSITFDAAAGKEAIEITGVPRAHLFVAVDKGSELDLTVKLSHVAPGGRATMITLGSARITVSDSGASDDEATVQPGEYTRVEVPLFPIAYQVPAGHSLRVSIAAADFPRHWPSPVAPSIRLAVGGEHPSQLLLPLVPADDWEPPDVPAQDPSVNVMPLLIGGSADRRVETSAVTRTVTTRVDSRVSAYLPSGTGDVVEIEQSSRFAVAAGKPDAAQADTDVRISLGLEGGARVEVHTLTWQTRRAQWGTATISLNGKPFFERNFRN